MTAWPSAIVVAFLLLTSTAQAQFLDPDRCWTCADSRQHMAGGALLDAGLQSLPRSWTLTNTPGKRIALVAVAGMVYEAGQWDAHRGDGLNGHPGYGFGLKDAACNVIGAVVTEGLIALYRKIAP